MLGVTLRITITLEGSAGMSLEVMVEEAGGSLQYVVGRFTRYLIG